VKGFITFRKGNLYLVVQDVAFRTFIHLEGGVDGQIGMGKVQPDNLIVNFIVEELLVGIFIFLKGLWSDEIAMSLFKVLLESTMLALVRKLMPGHKSEFDFQLKILKIFKLRYPESD